MIEGCYLVWARFGHNLNFTQAQLQLHISVHGARGGGQASVQQIVVPSVDLAENTGNISTWLIRVAQILKKSIRI